MTNARVRQLSRVRSLSSPCCPEFRASHNPSLPPPLPRCSSTVLHTTTSALQSSSILASPPPPPPLPPSPSNKPTVTAYLDSTCSMPTSTALTPQNNQPCYFLGPSDLIGSYKAACPDAPSPPPSNNKTNNNNNNDSSADEFAATATAATPTSSPGLQRSPSSSSSSRGGARRMADPAWWVDIGTKALLAMGAVEVVAWA